MYHETNIAGIKNFMVSRKQTLSVAESVTSGHLQAAISLADGATDFFQGGITTYNLGQKSRHLQVDPIHALQNNCVSLKTTEQMALHSLMLFSSDWAIGITGYATPIPELGITDLFAFYAIAFHNKIVHSSKIQTSEKGAFNAQVFYANAVFGEFNSYLRDKHK